ncbi:TPA: DUF6708 domain-containing protein [Pseudomonas putida]|nr:MULTISPECIES: DUF6708 domain-containing protein [Pseudomonas]MCE1003238.1 hypothetical protein [Pseudomonas sp. NMI1173_11]MCK2190682.1 hypothetical protein [Pseudomonas sp. MB04B]MDD2088177.1 hypothetical protein [Pseudomonas putida]MDD2098150.1 hypothetical protein [Pseudomonas putida]
MNKFDYLPVRGIGWKYDLPGVGELPERKWSLEDVEPAPNQLDENYIELSTRTISVRGVGVLIGSITLVVGVWLSLWVFYDMLVAFSEGKGGRLDFLFMILGFAMAWSFIPYVKLDFVLPRDEPIRFNRLRRKIYVYRYRFDRFYVFSRIRWGVKPVVYNWDDLTAEVYRFYAPGCGGLIENVMLSVRNPITDQVIDRFIFTHDLYQGEAYWAIARLFMQQGPEALPKFVHPPRDWNDDDGLSPMHRLAPKVRWPTEIDLESRSAPATNDVR